MLEVLSAAEVGPDGLHLDAIVQNCGTEAAVVRASIDVLVDEGHLYCTIDEERIIAAGSLQHVYTWVDAAYAVHPDYKSHTGGAMSMGRGILHSKSTRQKLNTKSSTEAELVGVSEYLPFNIWLRMFLKEQGYDLDENILYQDNRSAILMEKNGRLSSSQ